MLWVLKRMLKLIGKKSLNKLFAQCIGLDEYGNKVWNSVG